MKSRQLYRRHLAGCRFRSQNDMDCHCPIWFYRKENGKRITRSLRTCNWIEAERIMAGYVPKPVAPVDELAVARAVVAVAASGPSQSVYLIGNGRVIKIGTTADLSQRLESFRTANCTKLLVRRVFHGGRALEGVLHDAFRADRRHREWFFYSATIQAFIARTGAWNVT